MANKNSTRVNQSRDKRNKAVIKRELNEVINNAIKQYKDENPDIDVDAILSENDWLLPKLGTLQNRELEKFVTYAKEQGTNMPFDAMEMGVLAAGRKDMQNGLAEILDSLKFSKPTCPECGEDMKDRGRGKKNF